ncbi:MAG: hypothetical protein R2749_18630 [Acidimicrobiales bacterium]
MRVRVFRRVPRWWRWCCWRHTCWSRTAPWPASPRREAYRNGLLRVGLVRHHDDADALFGAWHDSWLDPAFRSWDIRDGLERIDAHRCC